MVAKVIKTDFYAHVCIFSLFCLFCSIAATAQTAKPCFTADRTRGCAPLTVTMTECTNGGENIGYNYGDGSIYTDPQGQQSLITSEVTHTYTKPGKYYITQYGTFNARGDTLRKDNYIEVLDSPQPAFTANTCQGRQVQVQITDSNYDFYIVNFGDGTFETLNAGETTSHTYATITTQSISVTGQYAILPDPPGGTCGSNNSTTITPIQNLIVPAINQLQVVNSQSMQISFEVVSNFSYTIYQKSAVAGTYQAVGTVANPPTGAFIQLIENVSPANTVYTYKVVAADVCGNTVESEEISSIPLTVIAANNQNELTWQTATSFSQFTLERNNQNLAQLSNAAQRNYTDAAIQCPNEYCYQVVGITASGALSVSADVCVKAISDNTPSAVQHILATIKDGLPYIQWDMPAGATGAEFILFRADNGGKYRELGRTTSTSFLDSAGNANTNLNTYCYQVRFTDACGNTSDPSEEACPVLLTRTDTESGAAFFVFNWPPYREWENGVQAYVLEKLDSLGNVYQEMPAATALSYQVSNEPDPVTQVLRFRVKAALNGTPEQNSYSNMVEIIQPLQIHFPTAFTPNGDGLNDVFEGKGLFIKNFVVTIYNRWGEVVFRSDNMAEGWDGKILNQDAPTGTYAYQVETEDFTGRSYKKKGSFTLLR